MAASALPSLRQLRYLVELAARLNFRQAADACFVTQSTLSAGIKELETVLGVQLVERDTRVVRITPVGEEVAARARELLAGAQDLLAIAQGAAKPLAGRLMLGIIPTVAPFLLPGLLPPLTPPLPRFAAAPARRPHRTLARALARGSTRYGIDRVALRHRRPARARAIRR